jgi:hypothetical protein
MPMSQIVNSQTASLYSTLEPQQDYSLVPASSGGWTASLRLDR